MTRYRTRTKTVTKYRTRSAPKAQRRRSRRGGGGGMPNLVHLGIATGALAYLTGDQGPAFVRDNAMKIPGAKTFGAAAAVGIGALAVDRFVKPNKWLKLAGCAGIVLAAAQLGKQGTSFTWLGDEDATADIGDDYDDVGDDYDDVGDDDDD